jgi:hypothetical protein
MTLNVNLLRAVCRANINAISIYDDVVQVVGTSRDTDEVAVEFPTPIGLRPVDVIEFFGVHELVVNDERTTK